MGRNILRVTPEGVVQSGAKPTVDRSTPGTRQRMERRSETYMEHLQRLDAGGVAEPVDVQGLRDAIFGEFPSPAEEVPLGLVATCWLGAPYEIHICNLDEQIIEHFKVGQKMPGRFEAARSLGLNPNYLAIEVYTAHLGCLRPDGTVTILEI